MTIGTPPAHWAPCTAVASQQSVASMRRGRSRIVPMPPSSISDILLLGEKIRPNSESTVLAFVHVSSRTLTPRRDQYTPGALGNQSDNRKPFRRTDAKGRDSDARQKSRSV